MNSDEFEAEEERSGEIADPASFTLWIDAEGGFLVVPKSRIIVGQADPDGPADIPIVADLEVQHLILHRRASTLQVEPLGEVYLRGNRLTRLETLVSGDILTLTGGVQLRLDLPNPLSGSARLVILSRHRTRPWSDGIVLMSDAVLLGPSARDHITCRTWERGIVLHRKRHELAIRSTEPVEVDGVMLQRGGTISTKSRVHGPDFSFSLEEVSTTSSRSS